MAIKPKSEMKPQPIEIDLTRPDGNVFFLIAKARSLANQIWGKRDPEMEEVGEVFGIKDLTHATMADKIAAEMMESDYEHAVQTFEKYFGNYVTMYR
jgi:outer membrane protein assembly factor BamD (BamD/ComL family)